MKQYTQLEQARILSSILGVPAPAHLRVQAATEGILQTCHAVLRDTVAELLEKTFTVKK